MLPILLVPAGSSQSPALSEPQSSTHTESHVYAQPITSTQDPNGHKVTCSTISQPSLSPTPHTATESHVYTEPSASSQGDNRPTVMCKATSQPSCSPPLHTATESQEFVYAQPHVTPTSRPMEPVSNPDYFYTRPHEHSVEVSDIS